MNPLRPLARRAHRDAEVDTDDLESIAAIALERLQRLQGRALPRD